MPEPLIVDVIISCAICAIIGFFCRRRILLQLILASAISIFHYAFVLWKFSYDPGIWSWRFPITSAIYQAPWFAVLYLAPTLFSALAVGKLRTLMSVQGGE